MKPRRLLIPVCIGCLGCTAVPDPGDPYGGSCPVLVVCANKHDPDRVAEYLESVGDTGTCWAAGPAFWAGCRSQCVVALEELNVTTGQSCGTCTDDADCRVTFGNDARCEAGYCERAQVGDLSNDDLGGDAAEVDMGSTTGVAEALDPECLLSDSPRVVIDTTLGVMVFELDRASAPGASDAFIHALSYDLYDNTIFHRVIDGLMIQGGGFGPGPVFKNIPPYVGLDPESLLPHTDAAIVMVAGSEPSSISSQWYITDGAQPQLDGQNFVFGAMVEGFAVRDAISEVPVGTVSWAGYELTDAPVEDVVVNDVDCVE